MAKSSNTGTNNRLKQLFTSLATGKEDSLKNRLIKGAAGSFGLKIAHTGLALVTSVVLARLLGTEGFGIYSYAMAWTTLLSIPATLGLDKLLVREVAIYQTQSAWNLMRGLLRLSNQVVLLVSIGLALTAAGVAWVLGTGANPQMLQALCIALISLPITSLRSLRLTVMKGLHQVVIGQLPEMLLAPVLFIALTGCLYWFIGDDFTVLWVVGIKVVTIAITFVIGAVLLSRILPSEVKKVTPKYQLRSWMRSALPFMFLGGMQIINSRTDILMLGAIKGAEAVGIYVVVNRGVQLITFILMAVNNVLSPTIASLYAKGNMEQLQQVMTKSTRVVFLVSLLITGSLIGFGYWFLLLFGSDFTQGQNALTILSIGQLVNASAGSVALLLIMTGHENYTTISFAASAAFNIILNAVLIPHWGIEGAATATASSMIIWNILSLIWVQKKLGINSTVFRKASLRIKI